MTDMLTGEISGLDFPQSNVLQFITRDGSMISARPSGTEPKIKFYCSVKTDLTDKLSFDAADEKLSNKLSVILKRLIETEPFFPTGMIQGVNDILLVVIILEIMRTVVVRFTDGIFQLDSFLIIGVIAAVRHILTVGAALTMEKDKLGEAFNRSLYEMGVNTGIVLALVFALFLSRSARKGKG